MQLDITAGAARVKSRSGFGGRSYNRLPIFLLAVLLIAMMICLPGAPVRAAGPLSFDPAVNYTAGDSPESVTTGDFNADGKTDLAVANMGSDNVSILLGVGDGTFAAPVSYAAGTDPTSVTTGDFNGDGKTDLAVANAYSDNVSILLGAGDGTFAAAVNYSAGYYPYSVTTGDFNADGKADLAVANTYSDNVSILLGAGDGTFAAAVNYAAGDGPWSVTTGDFNADGKTDLAVANIGSDNVSILLGVGDGTFAAAVNYAAGDGLFSVTTGDFNADGKADLAVANTYSDNVSILLGVGDGTFAAAVNYAAGDQPRSVTTGDFNADGKTDLAVANAYSDNVSILLGAGDGTFAAAVNYAAGDGPFSVTTGDFNADGKADLAVANGGSNDVSILINTTNFGPSGTFDPAVSYGVGNSPWSVTTGDFNQDGKTDLAVANYDGSNNVSILLGAGDGTFAAAVNYSAGNYPRSVTTGDFNSDGKADLAVANYWSYNVSILLGAGDGTFAAAVNYAAGTSPFSVTTGDFNQDGKADLAVANDTYIDNVSILLGVGDGTFAAAVNYAAGNGPHSVTTGDFNADGKTDLAVANAYSDNVSILLGAGDGTFAAAVNYSAGDYPLSVTTGDFNQDGKTDLAVANTSSDNVSILLGAGDGTFGAAVNYAAGTSPFSVTTGDFNQDGKTDLAVANTSSDNVSILLGAGDGSFAAAVNYSAGTSPFSVTTGDFNQDGKADLAVANHDSGNVSILLNHIPSTAKAITAFTIPGQVGSTTIDEGAHTVGLTMPYAATDVTALVPTITHTGASVSPLSGAAHDFTTPQTYTVTAEDASIQDYTVTVTLATPQDYYWPWYDSAYMQNWVLMANPAGAAGDLDFGLEIAGAEQNPGNLGYGEGIVPPGMALTPIYPGLMGGPVKVQSYTGAKGILSQRSLMGNSFEEVLGTEAQKLSDHYYWTWYDQASPGFTNWVLVANPSGTETVHAVISFTNQEDGAPVSAAADIAPGDKWTPTFPGKMGGPVEVKASLEGSVWPADPRDVIASQRVLSNYGNAFNEMPGIPAGELTDSYLWTWYDQQSLGFSDWVLIANPSAIPVSYEIKIGGTTMPITADNPGTIPAHGKVTPAFPGTMGGPVEVTSTPGNVIASQRIVAGPSFGEVPGYPQTALNSDYHWTWYDMASIGSSNWIMIANPSAIPVSYEIKIGGTTMPITADNPGTIPAHGKVTPAFPGTMGGPVEVISAGGNVMVSQRVLWNGYFNEVLGTVLD